MSPRTADNVPRAFPSGRSRPGRRAAPRRSRFRRVLRGIVVTLVLVPLLAYAALPIALRFIVPPVLEARGVSASLGWGFLDLWDLELTLYDLRVRLPGGPGITFAEARTDLARDALGEGRIELDNLRLRGAALDTAVLGETRWPDAAAAVPFGALQFEELRLTDLSGKLGRNVVVRHARLRPEAGADASRLRLEMDLDAGGGTLRIEGTLQGEEGVQTFTGTLDAAGLPAGLLDPAAGAVPSTWSGGVYAAADFELRHDGPAGRATVRASGSFQSAGVDLRLGGLAVAQADSSWEGTLTLSGPVFGRPERIYFQGTLDAATARVASGAGAASGALLSGLHWEGTAGWHGVPVAAGAGSVGSIEMVRAGTGAPPLRLAFDRVTFQASLDDAGRYRLERLRAGSVHAESAPAETEVLLRSLEAHELRATSDDLRVERLVAADLKVRSGGEADARRIAVERPVFEGVTMAEGTPVRAAGAALGSIEMEGPGFEASALDAHLKALRLDPQGILAAESVSLNTLEHRVGGHRGRARDLHGESLVADLRGALDAQEIRAARIAGSGGEGERWTAVELLARAFRLRSGVAEAGEARIDAFTYHEGGGDALEAGGLHAHSLVLRPGDGAAERLVARALRYDAPQGASWEARALTLDGARWHGQGARSTARAVSEELHYRAAGGERWRFEALALDAASYGADGEVVIEAANAERAQLDLPFGTVLEARGLRAGTAEREAEEGAARLAALAFESLALQTVSGLKWRMFPVEFESLVMTERGRIDARRVRSGALSLHDGEGGRWQAAGLAAHLVKWWESPLRLAADPLELEALHFTAAGGAGWRAEALLASAFDWSPGQVPALRRASAAAWEGALAQGLAWRLRDLELSGDESSATGSARFRVLSAGAGDLASSATAEHRFAWSGLRASDLEVTGAQRFEVERVVLGDVVLGGSGASDAAIAADRFEIGGLAREREGLVAETVTLDHSVVALGVSAAGDWLLPAWPLAAPAPGALALRIEEFATAGHSRMVFVDRRVEPPWEARVEPYRLRVVGFESIDSTRSARFELDGTLDTSARVEVNGEFGAAPRGLDVRARGRLKRFALPRLSGYARRHLGVDVHAGQGDLHFDLEVAGGEVQASGELTIRDVALEAVSADAAGLAFVEGVGRLAGSRGTLDLPLSLRVPAGDPGFELPAALGQAIAQSVALRVAPQGAGSAPASDAP